MLNKKRFSPKIKQYLPLGVMLIALVFFAWHVHAATSTVPEVPGNSFLDIVINLVDTIIAGLINFVGYLLTMVMMALIWIAQYNNFANSTAVANGWVIVRDICNMFFVLILLVIAIGTILKLDDFSATRLLKKFILMAIFINFSRLICGLIIDVSQVVMLTFVNGFKTIGGGSLATVLGLPQIIDGVVLDRSGANAGIDRWALMVGYLLAFVYVVVALIVVTAMVIILVMRVVMLWIYIILSPLAYLLNVIPKTGKWSSMIWEEFTKEVITGPVLAFFIWLSFVTLNATSFSTEMAIDTAPSTSPTSAYANTSGGNGSAPSDASTAFLFKFVISIGMLMGGLIVTQKIGAAGGKVAGSALKTAQGTLSTMTGARYVSERAKAFGNRREKARKEKVDRSADWLNRGYTMATAAPKTAVKMVGEAGAGFAWDKANKLSGGALNEWHAGWQEKRQKKLVKREEEKTAKKEHAAALYGAHGSGVYTDAKGDKYEYDRKSDRYINTKKDEKTGIETKTIAKDPNGKEFGRMSEATYGLKTAWNRGMAEYKGMAKTAQEKDVKDQQKKFTDAGLSNDQLLAVLSSASSNQTEKMAAAMTLAIKDGFKTKEAMDKGKATVKGTALEKEFKDNAIKKSAHLYYDLGKGDGTDDPTKDYTKAKRDFAKDKAEGKFDILNDDAYKNAHVWQALADSMTYKEFIKEGGRVANKDSKHQKAAKVGLDKASEIFNQTHDASLNGTEDGAINNKGRLNKILGAGIRVTGDLSTAVRGVKDDEQKYNLVTAGWKNSTATERVNMAEESLDSRDSDLVYKDAFEQQFVNTKNINKRGKNGHEKHKNFVKMLGNRDLAADSAEKMQEIYRTVNPDGSDINDNI